jgi:hypothetical protein
MPTSRRIIILDTSTPRIIILDTSTPRIIILDTSTPRIIIILGITTHPIIITSRQVITDTEIFGAEEIDQRLGSPQWTSRSQSRPRVVVRGCRPRIRAGRR